MIEVKNYFIYLWFVWELYFDFLSINLSILINEGVIYINPFVRVLNKDLSEHLEKVDSPDSKKVESKSSSPSDSWTKEELKEYMVDNGIGFNSGDTKQDLLDKIDASKGEE